MGAGSAVEHPAQEDLGEAGPHREHDAGHHDIEDIAVQDVADLMGTTA